jgi:hypothetical protein
VDTLGNDSKRSRLGETSLDRVVGSPLTSEAPRVLKRALGSDARSALLLGCAALLAACGREKAERDAPPTPPAVHSDVATVEKFVSLPGIVAVRWVEEARGASSGRDLAPGPTDLVLTAYVEINAAEWPALEKSLGGARGTSTFRMEESRAELMLPPDVLDRLPRDGNVRVVQVTDYDIAAIRTGTRAGHTARRIGSGLLMSFTTM